MMQKSPIRSSLRLLPTSLRPWDGKGDGNEVVVLMSGGVDSTISAALLRDAGWKVLGITMKIPVSLCAGSASSCCVADAALVCAELGVCHYYLDIGEAFEELVVEPFRDSYSEGKTPNPCVNCNALLKFSLVWDFLKRSFGVQYLATGHYARVEECEGTFRLAVAMDKSKDQSYFLYGISLARLDRLLFPLGGKAKPDVRKLALGYGLSVADKSESMDLCRV